MQNADLSFPLFLILFIIFWLAITAILSFMSGWHKLAQRFPRQTVHAARSYYMTIMDMRALSRVSYGVSVIIRISAEGIGLSIFPLYRFRHPPVWIPWSAVRTCDRKRKLLFMATTVRLDDENLPSFTVWGKTGLAIFEEWERHAPKRGSQIHSSERKR